MSTGKEKQKRLNLTPRARILGDRPPPTPRMQCSWPAPVPHPSSSGACFCPPTCLGIFAVYRLVFALLLLYSSHVLNPSVLSVVCSILLVNVPRQSCGGARWSGWPWCQPSSIRMHLRTHFRMRCVFPSLRGLYTAADALSGPPAIGIPP